jgi:type IV secretion system protein VirD4
MCRDVSRGLIPRGDTGSNPKQTILQKESTMDNGLTHSVLDHDANAHDDLHQSRILLGRHISTDSLLGFAARSGCDDPTKIGAVVSDAGEGHLLAIAPTGAGKGRNVIIPNLLTYRGPVIIIDPKGEAAMVTARRRRELGQRVVIVDPFGVCGQPTDALNPLDLLDPHSDGFESDCLMLAKLLTGGQQSKVDRFWDQNAEALLAGCIADRAANAPREERNLCALRSFLCDPDLPYKIACRLDTELRDKAGLSVDEYKNFLGHEGEKVRTSVRSTAMQHMTIFAGRQVGDAVKRTSFCLNHVTSGANLTIYLVIPPHKLEAYGALLRLWVATLLTLITRRESPPPMPTLLVLDELAQLGAFPQLRPAVTLLRGYGVRCMLFLQDVAQLKMLFPADYGTIINNCASVMSFGHTSFAMSREMADIFGDAPAERLFDMGRDALAVRQAGKNTRIMQRFDYLNDPMFAGMYDANRMAPRSGRT